MIGRILLAAVAAGLIAGAFVSVAQMVKVVPLIHLAERFESGEITIDGVAQGTAASPSHDHGAADGHSHGGDWAPHDGLERTAFTFLTNIVLGAGFGLLLAAGMALRGRVTDWRQGMVWGAGGYLAFSLLPALGLPPELPGMLADELAGRQIWWLTAVAGTAAGLSLIAFAPNWALRGLGALLILGPHVVGAPHPEVYAGVIPAEVAAQFVSASLVTAGLFWLLLGALTGHFVGRGLKAG